MALIEKRAVLGCGNRLMHLISSFSLFLASKKLVSHGEYSTGQCRDSAEPAVRQIASEFSLPTGKHVAITLGCDKYG